MAVVQATLNRGRKAAYLIGLGSLLVETLYCALPLFGLTFFLTPSSPIFHGIFLASVPLLLFLGIYTLATAKKSAIKAVREGPESGRRNYILYGITLCGTNPMVLFFWAQITVALTKMELLTEKLSSLIPFLIGVPVGTFLLYYMFIFVAHKQKKKIGLRSRIRMNRAVGIIFIGLAIYLLVNYWLKMAT